MARGLDHIAHAVRDLDAAGDLYRRLGFIVGARNRHPWGTHNRIVQLPGFFIEPLTVAEPDKLGADGFSVLFAGFTQDVLKRHEGLHLLLLESADAASDARTFQDAGIAASGAMPFEREGKRPDGTAVKVGFSVAFARADGASEAGFAVCQQHFPENFWNPAFQNHDNTAATIAGVVLVASEPARRAAFLSAYVGQGAVATSDSLTVTTPRGMIEVVTPAVFRNRFGVEPPDAVRGARLAAMRFAVRDIRAATSVLTASEIPFVRISNSIVVGPQDALGATVAFEPTR
jgi:catechol 2,3-dioxygenase-like lactoylglutathione lyase family enzyme